MSERGTPQMINLAMPTGGGDEARVVKAQITTEVGLTVDSTKKSVTGESQLAGVKQTGTYCQAARDVMEKNTMKLNQELIDHGAKVGTVEVVVIAIKVAIETVGIAIRVEIATKAVNAIKVENDHIGKGKDGVTGQTGMRIIRGRMGWRKGVTGARNEIIVGRQRRG
jgi:hypothetical protein